MEREQLRVAFRQHFGRQLGHALADALYAQSGNRFKPRTCWKKEQAERNALQLIQAARSGHAQLVDVDGKPVLVLSARQLAWLLAQLDKLQSASQNVQFGHPQDIFPENLIADEQFSRSEEASALIEAFFQITEEWRLTTDEARALLGHPGKTRFTSLRRKLPGSAHRLSEDELDRLVYITGIYYSLGILFSAENVLNWLRNPAKASDGAVRPWGTAAPMNHMLVGKMEHIIDVYRYVNGMRNNG